MKKKLKKYTPEGVKPMKVKPSLYAYIYYGLRELARSHGYNLVLHGSLDRDLDLICIPWSYKVKPVLPLMKAMAKLVGGELMKVSENKEDPYFGQLYQGRRTYIINMRRAEMNEIGDRVDYEYYLDISVTPSGQTEIRKKGR